MFLLVNGRKINYEEKGKGEPILFVHGWPASIKSLNKLYHLASKDYRSIIIDLPGFGKSDNPGADWGVGEYASHIAAFIHELGTKNVHYFGHSFGGELGIYLASRFPDVVKSLIISNSSYKRDGKPKKAVKILKNLLTRIYSFKSVEPYAKKYFYRIFFPNSDILKAPHLESNFRKIVTQDLTSYLKDIKAPTLILWGQLDTTTPIHWAHELNEKIKKSKLRVFPDATHNLPLKYPDEVFEEVDSFLS